VKAQEFTPCVEGVVGLLPERAALPGAASLGVTDGGDRQADEAGELRLCEAGGAAVAGEGGGQGAGGGTNTPAGPPGANGKAGTATDPEYDGPTPT